MCDTDEVLKCSYLSFKTGKEDEAIGILNEGISNKKYTDLLSRYEQLKKVGISLLQVQKYFDEGIQQFSDCGWLYHNRGTLFLNKNKEQSLKDLQMAIQLDPYDYFPYYNLFVLKSSMYSLQHCIPLLHCCLSNAYLKRGILHNFLQDIDKSIYYAPNNALAHAFKGIFLHAQNKFYYQYIEQDLLLMQVRAFLMGQAGKQQQRKEEIQKIKAFIDNKNKKRIVLNSRAVETELELKNYVILKLKQFFLVFDDLKGSNEIFENVLIITNHAKCSVVLEHLLNIIASNITDLVQSYSKNHQLNSSVSSHSKIMSRSFSYNELMASTKKNQVLSPKTKNKSLNEAKSMKRLFNNEENIYPLLKIPTLIKLILMRFTLQNVQNVTCVIKYNNKKYQSISRGNQWDFPIVSAASVQPSFITFIIFHNTNQLGQAKHLLQKCGEHIASIQTTDKRIANIHFSVEIPKAK